MADKRIRQISILLSTPNFVLRSGEAIITACSAFAGDFEDSSGCPDAIPVEDLMPLLSTIRSPSSVEIDIGICKVIKLLLRRQENREKIGKFGIISMLACLKRTWQQKTLVPAYEILNGLMNSCHEASNARFIIEEGGLPIILPLLSSKDVRLLASALGAIQGICFVPLGRQTLRYEEEYIRKIGGYLRSENGQLRARAIGVLHNFSIDPLSISVIRDVDCISSIVLLIRDPSLEVCQAAVGTIQNISRESCTRQLLLESTDIISNLFDLVTSNSVDCQV